MASTQPHQTPGSSQPLVVSTASGKNRVLPTASASPASGKKNREQYFVIVRNFSSNQIISIYFSSFGNSHSNEFFSSRSSNSNEYGTKQQSAKSRFGIPVWMSSLFRLCITSNSPGEPKFLLISDLKVLQFDDISFQCHAGHLVCSSCRPKLTCCPTCRGQLGGNIR